MLIDIKVWGLEKTDRSIGKAGDETKEITTHQTQTETLLKDNSQETEIRETYLTNILMKG